MIFVFFFALPRWTARSLSKGNPQVRVQAAMQLASSKLYFLYSRESKLSALTGALSDPEPKVRNAATDALKTMLKSSSSEEKRDVFSGIGLIAARNPKYSEERIGVMAAMTQDYSDDLRRESWNTLSNKLASERIPSKDFWMRFCTKFLSHENPEVRSAALGMMPYAGPDLTSSIPLFIKLLTQDPNVKVRCQALGKLLALKDTGKASIQNNLSSILGLFKEVNGNQTNSTQTKTQLSDVDKRVPETALLSIGRPAVPYLEELTKHIAMDVRWRSSELLKEILLPLRWQQSMDPFVPTFTRLMIDPSKNVRDTAVNFFMNLNCNSLAIEALAGQMGNNSSEIRKDISDAFQHYLLPQCLQRFRYWRADEEKEEFDAVHSRVGSAITLPLVKLLDHEDHEIRKDAALLIKAAHAQGLYPRNWDGLQIMRLEERLTSVLGK